MNKTEQSQVEFKYNDRCLSDSLSLEKCESIFKTLKIREKITQ